MVQETETQYEHASVVISKSRTCIVDSNGAAISPNFPLWQELYDWLKQAGWQVVLDNYLQVRKPVFTTPPARIHKDGALTAPQAAALSLSHLMNVVIGNGYIKSFYGDFTSCVFTLMNLDELKPVIVIVRESGVELSLTVEHYETMVFTFGRPGREGQTGYRGSRAYRLYDNSPYVHFHWKEVTHELALAHLRGEEGHGINDYEKLWDEKLLQPQGA